MNKAISLGTILDYYNIHKKYPDKPLHLSY